MVKLPMVKLPPVVVELNGATCQKPAIDSAMLLAVLSRETDFTELAAMGRRPTMPTMQKAKMPRAMTTSMRLKAWRFIFINFCNFQELSFESARWHYLFLRNSKFDYL
jgi:hypothetical protein